MRLSNKGMSLMELLISIALVGVVLVFIFQMLVDLKDEKETNNFVYDNQLNRIQAIKVVEDDLKNHTLVGIEDKSNSSTLMIDFHFKQKSTIKTSHLKITKSGSVYYFDYQNYDGNKSRWQMEGARVDKCGRFSFYKDSQYYYFRLNLFIYNEPTNDRNNETYNNYVDDIEIVFSGNVSSLDNTKSTYLNNKGNKTTKIGYRCT